MNWTELNAEQKIQVAAAYQSFSAEWLTSRRWMLVEIDGRKIWRDDHHHPHLFAALQSLGTPISELSGQPGRPGYERFKEIAASWGYD